MEEIETLIKDTLQVAEKSTEKSTEKTLSILELITSGGIGGNLVMGTLIILSVVAIYILIERYSSIKNDIEDESFLKSIQNFVEAKDIEAAKTLCKMLTPISE